MANTNQAFCQHQITRALRAATAAGVKDPHVKIHLSNGTVLHVGGGEVPTAPPKKSRPLRADLAEGGSTKMAGRGDRTTTAPEDSAGKQQPGSTAHKTSGRGSMLAEGGSKHMVSRQAAEPARAGQTGKKETPTGSKQASGGVSPSEEKRAVGGEARPARPGECGT